jgi:2,3-bisphosphoglycerate-dependent phosphoglycerate mutase
MKKTFVFIVVAFIIASCSRTVYVIRHAEKALPSDSLPNMSKTDPPLSEAGKVRAIVLKEELGNKKIRHIYSTNYIRTFYTADPLSQATGVKIQVYSNIDSLVSVIRSQKGNSLVVGHSNTVDDIVNKLTGAASIAGDLKDSEYDNLFVIKFKGKKGHFERRKYGYPSNP